MDGEAAGDLKRLGSFRGLSEEGFDSSPWLTWLTACNGAGDSNPEENNNFLVVFSSWTVGEGEELSKVG